MSIEAMKQALDALEAAKNNHGVMLLSDPPQEAWRFHRVSERCSIAITALRQAIEQAEQAEPVARKPLTDERVWDAYMQTSAEFDCNAIDLVEFARAIEAAHGITKREA
jgi:hypothetical protein